MDLANTTSRLASMPTHFISTYYKPYSDPVTSIFFKHARDSLSSKLLLENDDLQHLE